jgi:hypothetical protein
MRMKLASGIRIVKGKIQYNVMGLNFLPTYSIIYTLNEKNIDILQMN